MIGTREKWNGTVFAGRSDYFHARNSGRSKSISTTDDPARFKKLKKVILDTGKRQIDMEIQSVRFFKQFVIVKFKGIDNINDVEQYKGSSLFVSRENAVSLEENEYYIAV